MNLPHRQHFAFWRYLQVSLRMLAVMLVSGIGVSAQVVGSERTEDLSSAHPEVAGKDLNPLPPLADVEAAGQTEAAGTWRHSDADAVLPLPIPVDGQAGSGWRVEGSDTPQGGRSAMTESPPVGGDTEAGAEDFLTQDQRRSLTQDQHRSLPQDQGKTLAADDLRDDLDIAQEALNSSVAVSVGRGGKPLQPLLEYATRRRVFEVFSIDYSGVQAVGELAQALENAMLGFLPYIADFPQPVWVRVVSSDRAAEPFFQLQVSPEGNVGLVVYWNRNTSLESVCQGLSWALLQRVALWRWGNREEGAVPYWLSWALAEGIPVDLQRPRIQPLAQRMDSEDSLLPLSQLLSARQGGAQWSPEQVAAARLQAFWFYQFLREQMRNRNQFGQLLEAFLSPEEPFAVLRRAFPVTTPNAQVAQQWWEVGGSALAHRHLGVVYSLNVSDALVGSLDAVTAWWQGQDHRLRGPALWQMRGDARWQSAFWQRQREIKLELSRVNPVYFNALLSLGQFYDLLLLRAAQGQQEPTRAEAEAAYRQFLEDWAQARALRGAVGAALAEDVAAPIR